MRENTYELSHCKLHPRINEKVNLIMNRCVRTNIPPCPIGTSSLVSGSITLISVPMGG